jgi:hypothetical protein
MKHQMIARTASSASLNCAKHGVYVARVMRVADEAHRCAAACEKCRFGCEPATHVRLLAPTGPFEGDRRGSARGSFAFGRSEIFAAGGHRYGQFAIGIAENRLGDCVQRRALPPPATNKQLAASVISNRIEPGTWPK